MIIDKINLRAQNVVSRMKWVSVLHRFEEGAEQFRLDVAQNPNDTEESIWCFLCEAQLYGISEARKRFLEVSLSHLKEHYHVLNKNLNILPDFFTNALNL